ncbi:PREDICTED: uncharacterized protein LOC108765508 [Trachymyrmex cornetzi]|uniref:uncharacterized protein LOC108763131 n=1 Tax=Trachymyrmex cornetzi TaxID=471704 RepID=UPI00084F59E8|nr:PREDICTED: uncharacterized protein LOC108763131 [Trachymyrmex cornetzi]XP_018369768.1 PREDICTED: uncharacterized protein LOC108765508 [Trachymyrmex cornetzi]
MAMIEADPTCVRLNVLTQTASQTCVICNVQNNVRRLSIQCRVQVFIETNIYIPDNVRSCENHLDENGFFSKILLPALRFINRPYVIKGPQLQVFLHQLRNVGANRTRGIDENHLTDEEFQCIAPISKQQFEELFTYCDPVLQNGKLRYVSRKDLLVFLCKMRQGLSDDFLKVIFDYPSRQTVSSVVAYVRTSLLQRFVPTNIGPESITRQEFIMQHVTAFANELYNPQPEEPRAIAVIDSTYAYIHKSNNFRVLRQSYSVHKHRHLVKPTLIVASDGYILTIFGPYFSDAQNNDAEILCQEFERDAETLQGWFQNGDIVLVDRGYRDAIPLLQRLGIDHKMPALLERGQRQLSTQDANDSRIVTKNRWVVEARNGHLRSVFKFLAQTINLQHTKNLNEFYCIAGAILNRYHPIIQMQNADPELAREMLQRSTTPNVVQARVEVDNLRLRNAQWRRLNYCDVADFPIFDLNYLKDLTVGIYQINLASSYIQDKLLRDNDEEFQLDQHFNEPGFLRIRLYSRFRNATRHQIFISYETDNRDDENAAHNLNEPINGYYCTCQSGARTLGTCAHVASVLWYLGFARHQENIKYPDMSLLNTVLDAADREIPHNP